MEFYMFKLTKLILLLSCILSFSSSANFSPNDKIIDKEVITKLNEYISNFSNELTISDLISTVESNSSLSKELKFSSFKFIFILLKYYKEVAINTLVCYKNNSNGKLILNENEKKIIKDSLKITSEAIFKSVIDIIETEQKDFRKIADTGYFVKLNHINGNLNKLKEIFRSFDDKKDFFNALYEVKPVNEQETSKVISYFKDTKDYLDLNKEAFEVFLLKKNMKVFHYLKNGVSFFTEKYYMIKNQITGDLIYSDNLHVKYILVKPEEGNEVSNSFMQCVSQNLGPSPNEPETKMSKFRKSKILAKTKRPLTDTQMLILVTVIFLSVVLLVVLILFASEFFFKLLGEAFHRATH